MLNRTSGKLTVITQAPYRYYGKLRKKVDYWLCRCACGNVSERRGADLRNGKAKQCKSCSNESGQHKHGACKGRRGRRKETPEYRCWKSIKTRCYNPAYKHYSNYGARGIQVCNSWRNSFAQFLLDMGPRPSENHSIDRKDNNGHYCPENCYWATQKEQRRNKRTNRLITIQGTTMCLADWLEQTGTKRSTFEWRDKNGWTEEEAIFGRPKQKMLF